MADTFKETLNTSLTLTIGSDVFTISGGNIKDISLDLYSYGFEGSVSFLLIKDTLFQSFTDNTIIEARISVQGVHNQPDPMPEPLIVKGIVTQKSVHEYDYKEIKGNPVLHRLYEISFKDAPCVLWKQHAPIELYTDKKMKDIFKSNTVEGITLEVDWDALNIKHHMICLALGNDPGGATFYDFVIWYTKKNGGVCYYNYLTQALTLTDTKQSDCPMVKINSNDVSGHRLEFPETPRHNIRILNSSTEASKTVEVSQSHAVSGATQDIIFRSDIKSDIDTHKKLEVSKLAVPSYGVSLTHKQFPPKTYQVGSLVSFDRNHWSSKLKFLKDSFRVAGIRFRATSKKQIEEDGSDTEFSLYDVTMSSHMESEYDTFRVFPEFKTPLYPVQAEGTIISEGGKETDKTYQIFSNKKTSTDFYKVNIPLWNAKINVPFTSNTTPGHFFFPAFKNTRVLLSLHFDNAHIDGFLDWGEGTRLPMDSQGNHLLFGKNESSETSMKYVHEDNKPVFSILRVSGNDTELLKMEDGSILLKTQEDDSRKKESETFDLSINVAAAKAQLSMAKESATGDLTESFSGVSSAVKTKINSAVSETRAQLDTMESAISGKAEEITAEIDAAAEKLTATAAKLKKSSEQLQSDLKSMIKL